MRIFKNLKFWSIEGFAKTHHYRFKGDRGGTLIFTIDITMVILVLKHSMNTKNLGSLKKLDLVPRINSDKNVSNARKYTCSQMLCQRY